jgi:hypothetical protein
MELCNQELSNHARLECFHFHLISLRQDLIVKVLRSPNPPDPLRGHGEVRPQEVGRQRRPERLQHQLLHQLEASGQFHKTFFSCSSQTKGRIS